MDGVPCNSLSSSDCGVVQTSDVDGSTLDESCGRVSQSIAKLNGVPEERLATDPVPVSARPSAGVLVETVVDDAFGADFGPHLALPSRTVGTLR